VLHAHRRKQRRGHQPRILILAYILLSTRPGGKRDGSAHSTRQNMMMAVGEDGAGAGAQGPCLDSKERPGRRSSSSRRLEG
jgi:hypothetical protein